MLKEKKFRPVITRVKLNPEQAVLACCVFSVRSRLRASPAPPRQCGTTGCATGTSSLVSS